MFSALVSAGSDIHLIMPQEKMLVGTSSGFTRRFPGSPLIRVSPFHSRTTKRCEEVAKARRERKRERVIKGFAVWRFLSYLPFVLSPPSRFRDNSPPDVFAVRVQPPGCRYSARRGRAMLPPVIRATTLSVRGWAAPERSAATETAPPGSTTSLLFSARQRI